jgi:hypothetical protein
MTPVFLCASLAAAIVDRGLSPHVARFSLRDPPNAGYNRGMIRIREIVDPDLRKRIVAALAKQRECSVAAIPDWFELDDADYVDLLQQLRADSESDVEQYDPRM